MSSGTEEAGHERKQSVGNLPTALPASPRCRKTTQFDFFSWSGHVGRVENEHVYRAAKVVEAIDQVRLHHLGSRDLMAIGKGGRVAGYVGTGMCVLGEKREQGQRTAPRACLGATAS